MRKSDIKKGDLLDWGGELVDVIEIVPDGVIVANPNHGEVFAKAKDLKPA